MAAALGTATTRVVVCLVAAIAVEQVVPSNGLRATAYVIIEFSAGLVIFWGMRRNRPQAQLPWVLFGSALLLLGVSNIAWIVHFTGSVPYWMASMTAIAKVYALCSAAVGGAVLLRRIAFQGSGHHWIDSAIVVTGTSLAIWQWWLVAQSDLESRRTTAPLLLVIGTFTVGALAIRLLGSLKRSNVSLYLLLVAGALSAGAQTAGLLSADPTDPARLVDAAWLGAAGLLALAAVHPSMTNLETSELGPRSVTVQMTLLGSVLLFNPVLVWLHLISADANQRMITWIGLGMAVLTTLGVIRFGQLALERERMGQALERSEQRFRSLAEHASDVVFVLDDEHRISYASPRIRATLDRTPEEVLGTYLDEVTHSADAPVLNGLLHAVTSGPHRSDGIAEIRLQHRDGRWRDTEIMAVNLVDDHAVDGLLVTAHDVTERRTIEARLAHRAFHDELTGLANRRLFREQVERSIGQLAGTDHATAVLFIDLDDFKTVNDSLGHAAGDQLLRLLAARLKAAIRHPDAAARLGGDEFAVLVEMNEHGAQGADQIELIANRLLSTLMQPVVIDGRSLHIGASIGIAVGRGEQAEELLRNADTAMFIAKQAGKCTYRVFEPHMHDDVVERLDLKADLGGAFDRGELELHYQPIVTLCDQRPIGVEALARWRHPVRDLIGPDQFVPIAEETGLIVPLGQWVLRQACQDVQMIRQRSPEWESLVVCVNLSVRQIEHGTLTADVVAALSASSLPAECLVLEITESSLLSDADGVGETIRQLRSLGVRVAIDDFGTGFSSLGHLRRLDVDIVKVDRSFVRAIGSSSRDRTLVRGILDLTRSLGIDTIAEGIERADQVDDLIDLQCELGQGYHFGHALATPDIVTALEQTLTTIPIASLKQRKTAS